MVSEERNGEAGGGTEAEAGSLLLHRADIQARLLGACSWEDRARVMELCRRDGLLRDDSHWKWMCSKLHEEHGVHLPSELCETSWREAFERYFAYRRIWSPSDKQVSSPIKRLVQAAEEGDMDALDTELEDEFETGTEEHKTEGFGSFNISVFARMRPLPPSEANGGQKIKDVGTIMVLPLHQRLGLIRQQHKCSAKEARRILWQGDQLPDPWATSEVRVAGEIEKGEIQDEVDKVEVQKDEVQACVVAVSPGHEGSVLMCCPGTGLREFNFSGVLGEMSQQQDVYRSAGAPLVSDFMNGTNVCIFSYGQTGSGKTHTMFGPDMEAGACVDNLDQDRAGIVPRACRDVLDGMAARRHQGIATTLSVSYVEIYGDQVTDLLNAGEVNPMIAHQAVFAGHCAVNVESAHEMSELLKRGDIAKKRAATAMNDRSSRAHSLLLLSLRQQHQDTMVEPVSSTLCLSDLGGSEQVFKSGVNKLTEVAAGFLSQDDRLKEAVNINLGLLSLKTCIRNLVCGRPYVPFQDSRLTMMLSSALGGNCKTAVVVTGSSEKKHALETLQSLRFGEECGQIVNQTKDGLGAAQRAIQALDQEIEVVEDEIRKKERWETFREKRVDDLHQEGEATQKEEIVVTSKLVGAESEREHLELLLARRRILVGA